MIHFLEGILEEKEPGRLVLALQGVGYEVFIPLSTYERLPGIGQTLRLYIYDCVCEDDHSLFGFLTRAERALFAQLLGVTGIGPKLAMSLLSGLSPQELTGAIRSGDAGRLSRVRGVGRKTAERLIVELKDKFGKETIAAGLSAVGPAGSRENDAVLALMALGYRRREAEELVVRAARQPGAEGWSVEELVRKALAS
jgi:Holliday junction DNA helicase RuvA